MVFHLAHPIVNYTRERERAETLNLKILKKKSIFFTFECRHNFPNPMDQYNSVMHSTIVDWLIVSDPLHLKMYRLQTNKSNHYLYGPRIWYAMYVTDSSCWTNYWIKYQKNQIFNEFSMLKIFIKFDETWWLYLHRTVTNGNVAYPLFIFVLAEFQIKLTIIFFTSSPTNSLAWI